MQFNTRCFLVTVSQIALGALAIPASAQIADEASGIDEIIVTAQKRETNLQKTSVAVSVVSGALLRDQQVSSIEGLAQALPNVNFGQTTGNARIAVRGVGFDNISLGNEGRVAFHTDGVYISRPAAALASFYDVERIEVLRGPQGTLYGRNATGGAVNVISRAPGKTLGGDLEATVGNYDLYKLEGAVGGPISSVISGRLSFQAIERGGYGHNLTNGLDVDDQSSRAVRAQLRFQPSDAFDLTLAGDYFTQDDHAYSLHYLRPGSIADPTSTPALPGVTPKGLRVGGVVPTNLRDSTSDSGPLNDREFWGLSANAHVDLGFADLYSISAYRSSKFHTVTDLDATSARLTVYDQLENSTQFSQELRLAGDYGRGDWMIGGYYFDESLFGGTRVALDPGIVAPVPPPVTSLRQGFYAMGDLRTEAYAVFGSGLFEFTDELALRVGARYSNETKKIDEEFKFDLATPYPPFGPFFPAGGTRRKTEASWSSLTPSMTLEYRANDDLFIYATYSRGFKSGGFNLGNVQPPFAPEKITDYEAGVRASWLDERLRTNLSGFIYDYSYLQVSKVNGATVTIENAASAKVIGLEAEITALLTKSLRIDANVALLDSKYEDFVSPDPARAALGALDLSGNELTQAPHYSINLNASYEIPSSAGDFTLRGEARFVDKVYFTQYNLEHASQAAYELFNAFLTWEGNAGLTATAFIRNIANKQIVSAAFVGSGLVGFPLVGSFEPPRTYGLTLGYRF